MIKEIYIKIINYLNRQYSGNFEEDFNNIHISEMDAYRNKSEQDEKNTIINNINNKKKNFPYILVWGDRKKAGIFYKIIFSYSRS